MRDDLMVPSPRELAGTIRRRWWLAGLVAFLVFVVAATYLGSGATSYSASTKVLSRAPSEELFGNTDLEILSSDAVMTAAAERLGHTPTVSITDIGGGIFSITAVGSTPDVVETVNAYANAFVDVRRAELAQLYADRAEALQGRIAAIEQSGANTSDNGVAARRLEAVGEDLDETLVAAAAIDNTVRVLEAASGASIQGASSKVMLGASLVLAVLTGLLAPFAYEVVRGRVNTTADVQRLVPGLRVLADTHVTAQDLDPPVEAALLVRLAVEAASPGLSVSLAIAPVGSDPAPVALGTEVARQLSADAAVVEATVVTPSAPPEADDEHPTLLEMLMGSRPSTAAEGESRPAAIRLGSGDPSLLMGAGLRDVLADLGKQHSNVVVLAPSASTAEGAAVAAAAGRIVLTATAGRTKVVELRDALEQLETVGARVLGLVLTGVRRADTRSSG